MIRTRFAPSPTGLMHLGNARTALFAYLLARTDKDGVFVLRFEDTDKKRSERYYEDAIIEDLRWLGIRVNEGAGYGGSLGPYRQSERLAAHRTAVNHLLDIDRAYPCYCTAEELEAERQMAITARRTPRYSGRCRDLTDADRAKFDAEGRLPAIRFRQKMDGEVIGFEDALRGPYNFVTDDLDDFIIQRSDGTVSFLLASALDDADMKITHVVRGEDHLSNTPRQVQLLRTLERSVPQYWHLGLLMGPDQKPLSKRHGSATVADLREAGYEPEAVVSCLARMGWNPPEEWSGNPMDVFAKAFDAQGISPAPSVWDEARLDHDNAHVLRTMPTDRLVERIRDLLPKLTWTEREREALEAIKPELKNRREVPDLIAPLLDGPVEISPDAAEILRDPSVPALLDAFAKRADELAAEPDRFKAVTKEVAAETGLRGPKLFKPLRAALTGKDHGLDLATVVRLLSAETIRARLAFAGKLSVRD